MYRIDEFLEYYGSLKENQENIDNKWINTEPLPFYYGILTGGYWKNRWNWFVDSLYVFRGKAYAVTWDKNKQRAND